MNYSHIAIQSFFAPILCAVFFLVFVSANKHLNKKLRIYFYMIVGVTLLLTISDIFQGYFETFTYPTKARMFFASLSYSLRPAILFAFALLFLRNNKTSIRNWLIAPLLINIFFSFSAFFTQLSFYYTADNQIVRGPLITSPFLVSLFYFILILFIGVKKMRNGDYGEFIVVGFSFIVAIAATLLELYGRYQGFISIVSIVATIFYYLYFVSTKYTYDQLTSSFIRSKLYTAIERIKTGYSIITYNLNGLKIINDTKGHIEGDNALKTIVEAVREVLPLNAEIYRMGGDEFVILYRSTYEPDIEKLIELMESKIRETEYTVSIGYSIKSESDTIEQVLDRADRMMYEKKNQYKRAHNIKID